MSCVRCSSIGIGAGIIDTVACNVISTCVHIGGLTAGGLGITAVEVGVDVAITVEVLAHNRLRDLEENIESCVRRGARVGDGEVNGQKAENLRQKRNGLLSFALFGCFQKDLHFRMPCFH